LKKRAITAIVTGEETWLLKVNTLDLFIAELHPLKMLLAKYL
jgi:hypothetical protein